MFQTVCLYVIQAAEAEVQAVAEQTPKDPGAGFKGKKSKAAAKQGTAKRQWEILRDSGIPESEISEFRWTISVLLVLQTAADGSHACHLHSPGQPGIIYGFLSNRCQKASSFLFFSLLHALHSPGMHL